MLSLNWALFCQNEWRTILGTHHRQITPCFSETVSLLGDQSVSALEEVFSKASPDIVVNTAAITSVEFCERNPAKAYYANVLFASNVAAACSHLDIPLVHISTDHLFSGNVSNVTEEERSTPLNVYARTKAEAEVRVTAECENLIIVRTNFFGLGTTYRASLTDTIINQLKNGSPYYGFKDVFFTPILASDLANCVHGLIDKHFRGVFNISSSNRISKFDFAVLVAQIFDLPCSLVKSISISDRKDLITRPKDMSLSNKKVSSALRRELGTTEDGLRRLLEQANSNHYKHLQSL